MNTITNIGRWAGIAFALTAASLAPGATNYYVETTGSDIANTGTLDKPWQSISQALSVMSNGDTVYIGQGEYSEWLNITNSVTLSGNNLYNAGNPPFSRHAEWTVIRPPSILSNSPVITIKTANVTLQNLSIRGDTDTNGIPSAKFGVYGTYRPLVISNCVISSLNGFGIFCEGTSNLAIPSDDDFLRGYFGYNLITDISHTNDSTATGIFLQNAQATCEYNEFRRIQGPSANSAIYIFDCRYTTNMISPLLIDHNWFDQCESAIWANQFGAGGEKIYIRDNTVTEGLIGIHVTAAKGQAVITGNRIAVEGISSSSSATPARAIWVHADRDPWSTNTLYNTHHRVENNTLTGNASSADGTVGIFFSYATTSWTNINNGLRASASSNNVSGFDYGIHVESGNIGVQIPHDPLMEVHFAVNDIFENFSYGLYVTGLTNTIPAASNWWGSYFGATGATANPVSANVDVSSSPQGRFLVDTDADGINDWLDDDDDGDGYLDTYEMLIGTAPDKADSDGDGLTDWEEIEVTGTHPLDPLSSFKIIDYGWEPGTNRFRMVWSSVSNRTYRIYRTSDMVNGFGAPLTTQVATFPTNTFTDVVLPGLGPYFYSVSVTN